MSPSDQDRQVPGVNCQKVRPGQLVFAVTHNRRDGLAIPPASPPSRLSRSPNKAHYALEARSAARHGRATLFLRCNASLLSRRRAKRARACLVLAFERGHFTSPRLLLRQTPQSSDRLRHVEKIISRTTAIEAIKGTRCSTTGIRATRLLECAWAYSRRITAGR